MNPRTAAILSILVVTIAVTSCGGEGQDEPKARSRPAEASGAPGVLTGRILFEGDAPPPRRLAVNKDEGACAHAAREVQDVLVSGGGGLSEAIVEIHSVPGSSGESTGDRRVEIRQKDCMFQPRVLAVLAGTKVAIHNDDPVSHNVNSGDWNHMQYQGSPPMEETFEFGGRSFVRVNCNIHSWMEAWVYVARTEAYAMTGSDGSFRIEGVPPGTYEATVSHPALGVERFEVSIESGATVDRTVKFKAR